MLVGEATREGAAELLTDVDGEFPRSAVAAPPGDGGAGKALKKWSNDDSQVSIEAIVSLDGCKSNSVLISSIKSASGARMTGRVWVPLIDRETSGGGIS